MTAPTTTMDLSGAPRLDAAPRAAEGPAVVRVAPLEPGAPEADVRARIGLWAGDPAQVPGAALVKTTRRRVVARFPEQGAFPAVYVKQERILGFWGRVRVLVGKSHAEQEFENARELARRGVPAPRPVAFAAWKTSGWTTRTISVTEELRQGSRLDDHFARFRDEKRREAIAEAAAALEAIHRQGIDLTDCHRANLLSLTPADGGKPRLALLDLATVRFHEMGVATRILRLGQLLHSLRPILSYEERRLFIERYARAMGVGQGVLEDLVREVRAAEERVHQRRDRSRDRRCVVDSTEYYVRKSLTSRVYARRAMELETVRRLTGLGERIETLEREGARVVKREGRNECAVVRSGDATYFVKRVRSSSALGVLADAFRGSRGKRAWRAAHALSRRGLPTPRAHALAEWGFLLPSRSALLTQSLEKAETVQEVAAKLDTVFRDRGERVRFLTSLGELVGRLHNADVDHDDLALKNILVVDPRNPRFYFIDLDAVVGWRKGLTKVRVLRALMQLDDAPRTVSRTDRMRVLAAYERTTRLHLTREDLAEIRRMLRERFARSGRDYAATGPR